MGFFLVWPQVSDRPAGAIPQPLASLLPSCPAAAEASLSDSFLSGLAFARDPFEAAPVKPARIELRATDDPLLVARYVRDCDAEFGRDPPSSVRIRTSIDLMENEVSARTRIWGLPDLLADFEVWVDPASAQQRVIGDPALSAMAKEIDGLYVAYSGHLHSQESGRNQEGTALTEEWIAAWRAGLYVITVNVRVEDPNYLPLPTARIGVVSSRTFDGWHLLGRISLDLVNSWPFEDGSRPINQPPGDELRRPSETMRAAERAGLRRARPRTSPWSVTDGCSS